MGAKLSKKGSKAGDAKAKEEIVEPALTTFDKTATLPASFRKRNVNQEPTVSVWQIFPSSYLLIHLMTSYNPYFAQASQPWSFFPPFHVPSFW